MAWSPPSRSALESSVNNQRLRDAPKASLAVSDGDRRSQALSFLHASGADETAHLNGTLFDHLERTESLLRRWQCSEVVSIAGLCHAAYGTDGFPAGLITLEEREVLTRAVGPEVEALVYLYASCDRGFVYPRLSGNGPKQFRDRFTGRTFLADRQELRDFVDLTLANEADVGLIGAKADEPPEWLLALFDQFQHMASDPVRDGFRDLIVTAKR